jgi:hypothetical protein
MEQMAKKFQKRPMNGKSVFFSFCELRMRRDDVASRIISNTHNVQPKRGDCDYL